MTDPDEYQPTVNLEDVVNHLTARLAATLGDNARLEIALRNAVTEVGRAREEARRLPTPAGGTA